MRIGNGPRLCIPRGMSARRYRVRYWWRDTYEQLLAERWARIRRMPRNPAGDRKPMVVYLRQVPPGRFCRQVDGHGRSFGPRLTRDADMPERTRVRLVHRQEETLHSQLSRMTKAAHRYFTKHSDHAHP